MKSKAITFFVFLLFSALAEVSVSYTNADNQTLLIKFKAPIDDPSTKDLRIEITLTSEFMMTQNYDLGAICTITGPDGVIPPDDYSDTLSIGMRCYETTGWISADPPYVFLNYGELDGKNSLFQLVRIEILLPFPSSEKSFF